MKLFRICHEDGEFDWLARSMLSVMITLLDAGKMPGLISVEELPGQY